MGWLDERRRNGGVDEVPVPADALGRLWLCGKHFVGPDVEAAMARVGATAVVCLNPEDELVDRYPAYVAWLREHAGTRAVWFPVPDFHAPSPEAAGPLLADLHGRLEAGTSLLVHCGAGKGRAGTLAAALLIGLGATVEHAVAAVASARAGAGPEAGTQMELLRALGAPAQA